jgi:hypothetical protein
MTEETRELINVDEPSELRYNRYCPCTKDVIDIRECTCKYLGLAGLCLPVTILIDAMILVPQIIVNNIKLCIK